MRKVLQILAMPVVTLAFIAVGVTDSVAAQTTSCSDVVISNTGPGSSNNVYCGGDYTITINCSNQTSAILTVNQNSTTGTSTVTGNTNANNAISGTASNDSELDTIINGSCETITDTPAPVDPEPEEELGEVQGTAVVALPNTGSATPTQGIVIIAIVGAVILFALRTATSLYTRK